MSCMRGNGLKVMHKNQAVEYTRDSLRLPQGVAFICRLVILHVLCMEEREHGYVVNNSCASISAKDVFTILYVYT